MSIDVDLKRLIEQNYQPIADQVTKDLTTMVEDLATATIDYGENDFGIPNCNIKFGNFDDFDFNLTMDFNPSTINYSLLSKIEKLRALVVDINAILVKMVEDLDCCDSADLYNNTVLPVLKWLVEDENGFCGILLRIGETLTQINLVLKNLMCLFRPIPGNPTWSQGGMDFLKYIYGPLQGVDRVLKSVLNGDFLDILINPIKSFHDDLKMCTSNGTVIDYTHYDKEFSLVFHEYKFQLMYADTLEKLKMLNDLEMNRPGAVKKPKYPNITTIYNDPTYVDLMSEKAEIDKIQDPQARNQAMKDWNKKYNELQRVYIEKSQDAANKYQEELRVYLQQENLREATNYIESSGEAYENSAAVLEELTERNKAKYKPTCGCLFKIFGMSGIFLPKDYTIRSEKDLEGLIGHVRYKDVSLIQDDLKDIKIINKTNLNEIRIGGFKTDLTIKARNLNIEPMYSNMITGNKTIQDVIDTNTRLLSEKDKFSKKLSQAQAKVDMLEDELRIAQKQYLAMNSAAQSKVKVDYAKGLITWKERYQRLNELELDNTNASSYPPIAWPTSELEARDNNLKAAEEVRKGYELTLWSINKALDLNHGQIEIVDDTPIECDCNIICRIVQYLLEQIMKFVQAVIMMIVESIVLLVTDKELAWWMKFIKAKIQCIIDLVAMPKKLKEIRKRFDSSMEAAKGALRKMEDPAHCEEQKDDTYNEILEDTEDDIIVFGQDDDNT